MGRIDYSNWIKSDTDNKMPEEIKVGDIINGDRVIKITNLVNGKPTYASTFIVKGNND